MGDGGERDSDARAPLVRRPTLSEHGWELESAVARHNAWPDTFAIPSTADLKQLRHGMGVQLLFSFLDEGDRQTERMWVVIRERLVDGFVGVIDSEPVSSDAGVRRGEDVWFRPEHVARIDLEGPGPVYFADR